MKVVKKVRLLSKDKKGQYVKNENHDVLREKAVIQESSIEETNASYKETGILYIVDEKATKEWNDSKQPKKKQTSK